MGHCFFPGFIYFLLPLLAEIYFIKYIHSAGFAKHTSPYRRCPEDGCHRLTVCQGQRRSAQTGRTASFETDGSGSVSWSSAESTGGCRRNSERSTFCIYRRMILITTTSICEGKTQQNLYLLIPLPHLPQVIDVEFWLHIFFSIESYKWNLKKYEILG